ncbi:MAG: hypothetical protein IPO64_07035 [Bacteroidetes bacterium]|nr:hypothetical protein [Bacteroidota bacterium]
MPLKWEKDLVLDLPVYFSLGMGKPSKHIDFGSIVEHLEILVLVVLVVL